MNRALMGVIAVCIFTPASFAEVKIANAVDMAAAAKPDDSAMLEVASETAPFRGFLMPHMTTAERDTINAPAKGLQIYNESKDCVDINVGTSASSNWQCLSLNSEEPWYDAATSTGSDSVDEDIYHSGNVGIGVTAPAVPLHTTGGVRHERLPYSITYSGDEYSNMDYLLAHNMDQADGTVSRLNGLQAGYTEQAGTTFAADIAAFVTGRVTNSFNMLKVAPYRPFVIEIPGNDQNDGLYLTHGKTPFFFAGWDELRTTANIAYKAGGSTWSNPSDARIKKNVRDFVAGIETAMQLQPVVYEYNGRGGMKADGTSHIGFIAQDVQDVAPYMVNVTDGMTSDVKNMLVLDESALTKVLLNSIKEQQKMIEDLAQEVAALKANH